MVELSKKPLFIVYREKEINISLARTRKSNIEEEIRKSKGLVNLKELVVEP